MVMEQVKALTKDQAETGLWQVLSLNEAAIFHKYINAANRQLALGDECKYTNTLLIWFALIETKNMLAPQLLLRLHIKLVETHGSAVVYNAVLQK